MKRILALTLAFVMTFTLTACTGGKETPKDESSEASAGQEADDMEAEKEKMPAEEAGQTEEEMEAQPEEAGAGMDLSGYLGTKTGKFYSRFTAGKVSMKYEMEYDGQKVTMITATNGKMTYSESLADGVSMGCTIMDGEYMYTIDHANQMVIRMPLQTGTTQELVDTIIEESDVDMDKYLTGTRTIDGKTYDTEEWDMDGMTSIMCFDGDDLAYMVTLDGEEEYVIRVLEISDRVDESLFEIPADYQLLEM